MALSVRGVTLFTCPEPSLASACLIIPRKALKSMKSDDESAVGVLISRATWAGTGLKTDVDLVVGWRWLWYRRLGCNDSGREYVEEFRNLAAPNAVGASLVPRPYPTSPEAVE